MKRTTSIIIATLAAVLSLGLADCFQQTVTSTQLPAAPCDCPGDPAEQVNPSLQIEVAVTDTGSGFSVAITGGVGPFELVISDGTIENPYVSGQEVDRPAGSYTVFVRDTATGTRSSAVAFTLDS